jgi:hypothetical protein
MKSRWRISLLLVLVVAAAMVVFAVRRRTAPAAQAIYQGKTAQEWLDEWPTNSTAVMQAIQGMGTNAVPGIIEALGERDTPGTRFYRKMYPRLPAVWRRHHVLPKSAAELGYPAEIMLPLQTNLRPFLPELMDMALEKNNHGRPAILSATYQLFGPDDKKYVPALVQFLADTNRYVRQLAAYCLQKIGPAAIGAVPGLKTAMKDDSLDVRIGAAWAIWMIDRETNLVSAALKHELSSTQSPTYKSSIPIFLRAINPNDPVILPSLIDLLNSSDENKRTSGAISLWGFGPEASAAVPALTNAIESGSPMLRNYALRALKKIDPATATRYGAMPDVFVPPPVRVPRPPVVPGP